MLILEEKDSILILQTNDKHLGDAPLVSIIILNFNGRGYLEKCLKSVLEQNYPNFEIIFVDNASADGSVEFVKNMFSNDPRIKIIQNPTNLGASQARNIGIKKAKGKYIVFLDNDTQVTPNWLDELVNTMENNPSIGIAQSTLLKMNYQNTIQHSGQFMIDYCGWTWKFCKDEAYENFLKKHRQPITIFSAVTAAMIIRRNKIDEIGLFDPKFFIYFEDTDLSWRVWLRGYKVVSVPRSVVYHEGAGSIENEIEKLPFTEYNYNKNCLRMIVKNYDLKHILTYLPTTCVCLFAKALIQMARTKGKSMTALVKAFLWNIMETKDTIHERIKVQETRKVSDKFIIKNAMRRLPLSEIFNRI